jgi:hypothetical protein
VEAVNGDSFLLGTRVRFKDGAIGRLKGVEVGTEPWTLNALLVQAGLLHRRLLRTTVDAVSGAGPSGIDLHIVRSEAEPVGRDYRAAGDARILDRSIQLNVGVGHSHRLAMEVAGLAVDRDTNQVTDFVGISLIRRSRLLVSAEKALWQRKGWIGVELGPGGLAKPRNYA